jgi:hypothetical protein
VSKDVVIEGDLILKKDYKINGNLTVYGNISGKDGARYDISAWNIDALNISAWNIDANDISAWNIDAWDIDAKDIDALDIICERRIKKFKESKTICRVFIQNKSQLERKEQTP